MVLCCSPAAYMFLDHFDLDAESEIESAPLKSFKTGLRQVYGYFDANISGITGYTLFPLHQRALCDSQLASIADSRVIATAAVLCLYQEIPGFLLLVI